MPGGGEALPDYGGCLAYEKMSPAGEHHRATFVVGHTSNVALVAQVRTSKTPHQVGKVKMRILKQYPNWRDTFAYLNPANIGNQPHSPPSTMSDSSLNTSPGCPENNRSGSSPLSTSTDSSPQAVQRIIALTVAL